MRHLATLLLVLLCSSAFAQKDNPLLTAYAPTVQSFATKGTTTVTVGTVSAYTTLAAQGPIAWTCNTGNNTAYVLFPQTPVVVTPLTGFPVPAGACVSLDSGYASVVSAITASGSTSLSVVVGFGAVNVLNASAANGSSPPGTPSTSATTVQGSASGIPIPVTSSLSAAFTPTSNSGVKSLANAATDYTVLAANSARRFLMIQNTGAYPIFINSLGGSAYSAGSYSGFYLPAGASFTLDTAVSNTAIHAASPNAGQALFIMEG